MLTKFGRWLKNASLTAIMVPYQKGRSIITKTMSIIKQKAFQLKVGVLGLFNRKPAFLIKRNGIEIHFFNFANTDALPFDKNTYQDTQIFIGDWANPWYVDIDSIEEQYDEFSYNESLDNLIEEKHVTPSQTYKTYMGQRLLADMIMGAGFDEEKIVRILYAIGGAVAFILLLLIGRVL